MKTLVVMMAFALVGTVLAAAPKEGDFSSGWNTWATTQKGDWAEYKTGQVTKKWLVTDREGDKITYDYISSFGDNEPMTKHGKPKHWQKIRMANKPMGDAKWEEATKKFKIGDKEIDCVVVTWKSEKAVNELWYSKEVPCGGIVKYVLDGNVLNELSGFGKGEGGGATAEAPAKVETDMPAFYATKGNWVLVKTVVGDRENYVKISVTSVAKDKAGTSTTTSLDKDGNSSDRTRTISGETTKADLDTNFAKPVKEGVTVTIGDKEYLCNVYEYKAKGKTYRSTVYAGIALKEEITIDDKKIVKTVTKIEIK